jgi:hypothetical protein
VLEVAALLERLPHPIRLTVRIDVQHNPRDLAPVHTFRIRIKQMLAEIAHGRS